nr:AraC family transcriptional regulator [uncultured Flavobacterium sp.]
MKPHVQKLPLSQNNSFVARTYATPNFEVSLHQHIENELILFTNGEGLAFIGNDISEFKTGDIYFLGSNVPHTFQKRDKDMYTSAIVIQFKEEFWGNDFLNLPENLEIKQLIATSKLGLKLKEKSTVKIGKLIIKIQDSNSHNRILLLYKCLAKLTKRSSYIKLTEQQIDFQNTKEKIRIEKVFNYSIENFRNEIKIKEVADLAGMTKPAFCNYFKKSTKKSYINFLNEIRIGHACSLLLETNFTIADICYDSGFQSIANFNKQFLKLKNSTPSKYRILYKKETFLQLRQIQQ